MPSTIKDIKEETGLSLATISKYLNGGNVLPKNREMIEEAIEKLHYQVNEIARGLVTNKTRSVGISVHNLASPFNGTLIHYIGNELRKKGYSLIICDSDDDEQIEANNIRFLLQKKVDGIIVISVSNSGEFLQPAVDQGIPVVVLDRKIPGTAFDSVTINNRESAYNAVKYLISIGHTRIAIICSEKEITGIERYYGYLDALREAGIQPEERYQKKGRHSSEYGYQAMRELLHQKNRPTAVFMTNYDLDLGAVMAMNEEGVSCPREISLLGFDDLIVPHVIRPRLTVVVQPMEELGEKTAELMLQRLGEKEPSEPKEIVLKAKMNQGGSVAGLNR